MNPAFPASEVDRIKNDLKRTLAVQKGMPQNQAREKFVSLLYKDHPYGRFFPSEEMLDSYNVEAVKAFYERSFGAQRSKVYVVGKFDEAPVLAAIEESFGKWKKGPEVIYPAGKAAPATEMALIDRPAAPQTTVIIGLPMVDASHPEAIAMRVTNAIIGGSFGSRITRNIREDKGYTYSPGSAIQNGYRTAIWYELADVTSEHTADAIREIKKEITTLQNEPPSAEELKGIQNYLAGIFVIQNSSPAGIISLLHFQDFHGLKDTYLTNFVKDVYAVKPEKVQQLVKEHLKVENMTIVMVGDKKQVETQLQAQK
jgi:predicted Zn-dependent peptidase